MSPLPIETDECRATWRRGDGVTHCCVLGIGHNGAHSCYCGCATGAALAPAASPLITGGGSGSPAIPPPG